MTDDGYSKYGPERDVPLGSWEGPRFHPRQTVETHVVRSATGGTLNIGDLVVPFTEARLEMSHLSVAASFAARYTRLFTNALRGS